MSSAFVGFLLGDVVGTLSLFLLVVRPLWRCIDTASSYAVDRSDFTEAGRAYSDMATVITLAMDKEGCDMVGLRGETR